MASHNPSGPSALERRQMRINAEDEEFGDRLVHFPNSFQHLENHRNLSENALKSIRNHLEAALKAGYRTSMETAQSLNLLSFALFKLKEKSKALERVNEVLELEGQHENIVSLANKAFILWHVGKFRRPEALEQVQKLELLKESKGFGYLIVKAKAELAASYMRFGHRYTKYAIKTFNDVIPHGREPELWNWKLALATAHRQTLSLQHAPNVCDEKKKKKDDDKHKNVMRLLQEVADESNSPQLKANALAEMVLADRSTWDDATRQDLRNKLETGPMKLCKNALECADNEPSVLRKVGQIFRYHRDVHNSLKYLTKAVELQPSSAAYHHLGLTYKAFATDQKHGKLRKRRGRRLGGRRRGGQQGRRNREQGEAPTNENNRNVHGGGQKEGANTVRPQPAFQNERRSCPSRGQKQLQHASTHTTEHNLPLDLRKGSRASSDIENNATDGIPLETESCGAVGGEAYSQTAQNRIKSCARRVQNGRRRAQFKEPGSGHHGEERRSLGDTEFRSCPQQQTMRHRQDGEADFEFSRPESVHTYVSLLSLENHDSSDSETELKKVVHENVCGDTESDEDAEQDAVNSSKVKKLLKTIKSPPNRGITEFSWDDTYVKDAVDNLKQAVEFSAGENTRAMYDLAIMYKVLREYDKALECLEKIYEDFSVGVFPSAGPLDAIDAYEQAGLIKQKMAEEEQDDKKKTDLKRESDSLLNAALLEAFQLYSTCAELREHFADVFQSPRVLLRAVKESGECRHDKRKKRAELLRLIHQNHKSLAVLEQMSDADPMSKDDAECQIIRIRNLCDMDKYDEAVISFGILKNTQLGVEVHQKLGSKDVQDMYVEAGRRSLQQSSSSAGTYFKSAFTDVLSSNQPSALQATATASGDSAAADTSSVDEHASDPVCDIVILHEEEEEEGEEIEEKGEALAGILKYGCGLRVTRMYEDLHEGSQAAFEILNTIDNCRLLVVLVGKDTLSRTLQTQIQTMLVYVPTAVLLVNGAHLPASLDACRSRVMNFPQQLMNVISGDKANIGDTEASNIVDLFTFLLKCKNMP